MGVLRVGWLVFGLAWLVPVLVPMRVQAQADASRDAEARGLFDAATAAFDDGRFEDAFAYFDRAHTLSGRPQLLFNLASTCERLRRDADAIDYYERYIAAIPGAENRRFVEGRIAFLREALARAETTRTTPTTEGANTTENPPTPPPPAEVARQAEPTERPATPRPIDEGRTDEHRGRRRALWITAAVVAVSGVAAGVLLALRDPGTEGPIPGDVGAGGIVVTLTAGGGRR